MILRPPAHTLIPGKFGSVVREVTDATQAPIELVTAVALAAASLAVQGCCTVSRKPGLEGPVSLVMLPVCDSGERKTAVQALFFQPYTEIQRAWQADALKNAQDVAVDHEVWSEKLGAKRAALQRASRKGAATDEIERQLRATYQTEPKTIKARKLVYQDATPEALLSGLNECGRSAALVFDEFGHFINGRMSKQLPLLNTIWSGGDITVDRKTGDSFTVNNPRLTCLLQAQPGVIQHFLQKFGAQARDSGFTARALITIVQSTQGTRFESGVDRHFHDLGWFHEQCKTRAQSRTERVLKFTPKAQLLWYETTNMYEVNCQPGGCNYDIRDFASKGGEHIARVAAVLHAFEHDDSDEISEEILIYAINLVEWYRQNYKIMMAKNDPILEFQNDCQTLYAWIAQSIQNNGFYGIPTSHILQYGPNRLRKESKMKHLLEALASSGQILITTYGKKRFVKFPPPPVYLPPPPPSLFK